jgi:hypothetical protein
MHGRGTCPYGGLVGYILNVYNTYLCIYIYSYLYVVYIIFFKMRPCYFVLADLELLGSSDFPSSVT